MWFNKKIILQIKVSIYNITLFYFYSKILKTLNDQLQLSEEYQQLKGSKTKYNNKIKYLLYLYKNR
jgi:hypothetical protein